ncbi:MAG: hypothetical protein F4Z41_09845 [Acidimicrobiia bacterium]|nr:hypothetical protein [Acidimicrobiia bacterium]MYA40012.1 hypothetical protein [Acidimicrobiia bacterium]MYB79858.1 hypothetical protein [Acidimicrobiia bacterium]MYD40167.1 hypothetical protein [Acidimicrobiia bacterium]MYH05162.1 hypothetical protein [Acidimicrobiia bacterium]
MGTVGHPGRDGAGGNPRGGALADGRPGPGGGGGGRPPSAQEPPRSHVGHPADPQGAKHPRRGGPCFGGAHAER